MERRLPPTTGYGARLRVARREGVLVSAVPWAKAGRPGDSYQGIVSNRYERRIRG